MTRARDLADSADKDITGTLTVDDITASGDVSVAGNLSVSGTTVTIDSANAQTVDLGDNDKIRLGDGDDLQIYHDGNHSRIKDLGTGSLVIGADEFIVQNAAGTENKLVATTDGAVTLSHNGSTKIATTATGVDVTGALKVAGSSVVTASTDADDLVIEKTGDTGLSILSTSTGRIYFGDAANDDAGSIRYVHGDNSMRFETDDAERMRISGGNLFVGTTGGTLPESGTTSAHAGVSLDASNYVAAARYQNTAGFFNRIGNDGDLVQFRKDGTTVGSIGNYGTRLRLGSAVGAGFVFGGSQIYPATDGTIVDDTHDIGTASYRFNNLYLSGGAYLGGTTSANKLEDYEEGTWTPNLLNVSLSSQTEYGRYTKIGRIVHLYGKITATGSITGDTSVFAIGTLPFTVTEANDTQQRALMQIGGDCVGLGSLAYYAHFRTENSTLNGVYINGSGNTAFWRYNNLGANTIEVAFQGVYYTAE